MTAIVSTSFLSPRQKSKHEIESHLETLWNEEWVRSPNGEYTRSFFRNIKSARWLLTLTMDRATAQIVSGHSLLKSHQHRFGFVGNPSCECGYRSERIDHFLFSCPLFILTDLVLQLPLWKSSIHGPFLSPLFLKIWICGVFFGSFYAHLSGWVCQTLIARHVVVQLKQTKQSTPERKILRLFSMIFLGHLLLV